MRPMIYPPTLQRETPSGVPGAPSFPSACLTRNSRYEPSFPASYAAQRAGQPVRCRSIGAPDFAFPIGRRTLRASEAPLRATLCAGLERLCPSTFSLQIENVRHDVFPGQASPRQASW